MEATVVEEDCNVKQHSANTSQKTYRSTEFHDVAFVLSLTLQNCQCRSHLAMYIAYRFARRGSNTKIAHTAMLAAIHSYIGKDIVC